MTAQLLWTLDVCALLIKTDIFRYFHPSASSTTNNVHADASYDRESSSVVANYETETPIANTAKANRPPTKKCHAHHIYRSRTSLTLVDIFSKFRGLDHLPVYLSDRVRG